MGDWLVPVSTHQQMWPVTQWETLLKSCGLKRAGREMALRLSIPPTPTGQLSDHQFFTVYSCRIFCLWVIPNLEPSECSEGRIQKYPGKSTSWIYPSSRSKKNKPARITINKVFPRSNKISSLAESICLLETVDLGLLGLWFLSLRRFRLGKRVDSGSTMGCKPNGSNPEHVEETSDALQKSTQMTGLFCS